MNGCGCNYWKELIKSAWGLATTSVRAVKTKDETKYPDGDGLIDLSDISGGEGPVTSVNGKQPDAQGNVAVGSADISTPDGTVQGDIETLGANLASEIAARTSGDESLRNAIAGKQDALTSAQQEAVDSGITKTKVTSYSMTTQNLTRLGTRVDTIDDSVTAAQSDISQLKISDAEHTETLADQAKQLSSQATEITAIKTKDASQDSSISALQTKTTTHDTEIQGLSESVVSDLTGTFTDSTRTLKLSLERESAPSIDCSVVIPEGTGGGDVTSVNGKTGAVTIGASDVLSTAQLNAANSGITASKVTTYDGYSSSKQNTLSTAQLNAVNSGITASKVTTYDGYATTIAGKQGKLTPGSNITISDDNVISATGGSGAVESVNGKTGKVVLDGDDIYANDDTVTKELAKCVTGIRTEERPNGLNLRLSHPNSTFDYSILPDASATSRGVIQVGSGLSISNGVLSATGGGGGGASLPADGYYWQKITEENWPTDWVKDDVMLIYLNFYVTGTGTNWATVPSSIKTAVSTVTVPYMITFESTTCSISGYSTKFIPIMLVETTGVTKWNTSGDIISIRGIAFNGAGLISSTITTISRSTISRYGLYRLCKFSS